ncbi:MAG: type III pantothenate kinase [Clostridia bacterium]|nr:type III pantothenate kinase [Clostridia bacterium]
MILTTDIGNTHTRFTVFDGEKISDRLVLSTVSRTPDETAMLLSAGLGKYPIDGAAACSVVPPVTAGVISAVRRVFSCDVILLGRGVKTGLDIRTDYQSELGADIVAAAVGARRRFSPPFLVFDLGTATTASFVDEKDVLTGVSIMPGVGISAEALSLKCAGLCATDPLSEPDPPLLGRNTPDALSGGILHGHAAMIDGITERISEAVGQNVKTVLCGGYAERISRLCRREHSVCPDLTAEGLKRIREMNRPVIR